MASLRQNKQIVICFFFSIRLNYQHQNVIKKKQPAYGQVDTTYLLNVLLYCMFL